MTELDKIKQSIREQGHFIDEKQIDWIARAISRHQKVSDLQQRQIDLFKQKLNKKSS